MIEVDGNTYYFDLDALDKAVKVKRASKQNIETEIKTHMDASGNILFSDTIQVTREWGKEIDGVKYDTLRLCMETLVEYDETIDATLGVDRALAKMPLAFQIAFNTLLESGVLKETKE